jgi:hypothetical protein
MKFSRMNCFDCKFSFHLLCWHMFTLIFIVHSLTVNVKTVNDVTSKLHIRRRPQPYFSCHRFCVFCACINNSFDCCYVYRVNLSSMFINLSSFQDQRVFKWWLQSIFSSRSKVKAIEAYNQLNLPQNFLKIQDLNKPTSCEEQANV